MEGPPSSEHPHPHRTMAGYVCVGLTVGYVMAIVSLVAYLLAFLLQ